MIGAAWAAAALADVSFETELAQGRETVVAVARGGEPVGGATVRVVVRPGLAGSREIAVGITDGHGRVRWTPEHPGLTTVRAGDESVSVLVAAASPPPSPIVSLALLGLTAAALLGVGAWRRAS